MNYLALGVVGRPFGIRGEIRIRPHNPRTAWFDAVVGVWLRREPSDEPDYFPVLKSRRHKDMLVLTLKGVLDRDQADLLKGMEVVAPEDQLDPLEEGEYYWHQLIGMSVENTAGKLLGTVDRIEETDPGLGGNDVFVVAGDGGEIMIPATEEAVSKIDMESGKMVVNIIPGLTD